MDPNEKTDPSAPKPAGQPIDPASFLLPKKEGAPSPDSAQRINAGALLAQEQAATLTPEPVAQQAPTTIPPQRESAPGQPPNSSEDGVRAIQTFKSDVERVVTDEKVSVVSIASAEAARRSSEPLNSEEAESKAKSFIMIAAGVLLVALAAGVVAAVVMRPTSLPITEAPYAPFIFVDESSLIELATSTTREIFLNKLVAARKEVSLSLGLVQWLALARPLLQPGEARQLVSADEFMRLLAPQAPDNLVRSLDGAYLFGVHSFDENQPFLLLGVESYETAYRGMLDWERTMRVDLGPLFVRTPSPRIEQVMLDASSTPIAPIQVLQTGFVDKIVENRDTRAITNEAGDILLMWTFLGRNIVLVTTNEYTLREALSRLSSAPVVPNLQQ